MNGSFRQSMTWLHTWSCLVFCWIIYYMFVTGTLGYVDSEIDHWMEPEVAAAAVEASHYNVQASIQAGVEYLKETAPGAKQWRIFPANSRQSRHIRAFWQMPEPEGDSEFDRDGFRGNTSIDIHGLPIATPRDTGGGQLLYRMHYRLHYLDRDHVYRFIGVVTMLMFIGIITGVVVHKRIFSDLFTFRPNKDRRSWLDMHNLASVSSLPFQLMITYSGLIFMIVTWMPGIAIGGYGFDVKTAQDALSQAVAQEEYTFSGEAAPIPDLSKIIQSAHLKWDESSIDNVTIEWPGDANSKIILNRKAGISSFSEQLIFDGKTGEFISEKPAHQNMPIALGASAIGLHEGLFAGPILRLIYLFSGALGTLMIATGAIYWTVKRRDKALKENHKGYRCVEALNIGTIMGLPIAIAAYFWANRILPVTMTSREEWEAHALFLTWAVFLIHPLFRPSRMAWKEQSYFACLAFLLIPVVSGLTTDSNLVTSMRNGDNITAYFELVCLGIGIAYGITAWRISQQPDSIERPKKINRNITMPEATS